MQNKTLQSFVKTLEVLIGLIEWIPPGQQMKMSFVLTNSGSILSPHSLRWLIVTPRLSRSEYVV